MDCELGGDHEFDPVYDCLNGFTLVRLFISVRSLLQNQSCHMLYIISIPLGSENFW